MWSVVEPKYRARLTYAGKGRPPEFCSQACKQQAYRRREAIVKQQRQEMARQEAIAERARRKAHAHERIERQVREVIAHQLTTLTRVSTTQKVEMAQRITNALFLADLVDTSELAVYDLEYS